MVRKLILTSLAISALSFANAQYKFDFGARLGASNYLGDIGGKEQTRRDFIWDVKMRQTRWVAGGFARYRFNKYVAANAGLSYIRIQGNDNLTTNPARKGRNLNFKNDMADIYLRAEGYFFSTDDLGSRGRYYLGMKAYGFAGVSGLIHGPKTTLNGSKEKLRPLQTEGVKYGLATLTIPMGFGLYFTHKRENRFGFEMCWMKTFSDYLDDISTVYVDPATLPSDTSRELYNRNDELTDKTGVPADIYYGYKIAGDKDPVKTNKRGDDTHKDAVLTTSFTYSRVLPMYGPNTLYRQFGKGDQGKITSKRKIRAKF